MSEHSSSRAHILIIDDDNRILALLKRFLHKNGFQVSEADSVAKARDLLLFGSYDLIILDVMLPQVTGLDFAKAIRNSGNEIPIVMLTALSEVRDRVNGLEAGASDYLTKPFEPRELLLRINNLINNYGRQKQAKNIRRFGDNYYNFDTKEFVNNGQVIMLSSTEQKLMEILINCAGTTVSREDLSKIMGGLCLRSIDVQITRIRSKIENDPRKPKYLKTVRNEGYALYI